ncbi:hypothetical protein PVAP13_2NG200460 [Panicum virgatum]|uniref:Uncharacterized protein n=1 Tax=Panicum virgatum TaxID=38727 RepID=A0A8T0VIH2_PANVG|nr:hypothetical protein PVAP13_2NG200460 [Panicum virgatum]
MSARVSNAEAQVWEKLELGYTSLEKRKPCARNVLWKQLETPKTSESNFSVSNKMFRCIIFVTICSSSFEFPEKNRDVSFSTCTYMYLCI